jgi:hypothetical protein
MREERVLAGLPEIGLEDILNRFVLIVGEVNRGKTTLTQGILRLYRQVRKDPVTVVDLAPSTVPKEKAGRGVGGKLLVSGSPGVRYFHGHIHAPRLQGRDEKEAFALAEENRRVMEFLFEKAFEGQVKALFVNDCSLYLHAGEAKKLLSWIRRAETAVVNGYYGESLGPGPITARERAGMEYLMEHCDKLIQI